MFSASFYIPSVQRAASETETGAGCTPCTRLPLLSATRLMMSLWYDPESTEYRKQSTEYRVQSTEHRKQSTEYRVQKTEYRVQSTEFRVQGTEYRVQSTEYRVQKTEYRVQSTEYRILPADSPASPALWQSYRNVAPRHKDVNWPSRASQSTGEWHFWEARPAWYNLTALSLYFSSHWQVHRPVCTQGRQRPHGHILGSAGHQPRAGHGGGEQVRWSPHGRVGERERERERWEMGRYQPVLLGGPCRCRLRESRKPCQLRLPVQSRLCGGDDRTDSDIGHNNQSDRQPWTLNLSPPLLPSSSSSASWRLVSVIVSKCVSSQANLSALIRGPSRPVSCSGHQLKIVLQRIFLMRYPRTSHPPTTTGPL